MANKAKYGDWKLGNNGNGDGLVALGKRVEEVDEKCAYEVICKSL